MFDKFEVLMSWKLSWGLSFLLLGVSDGHIFFDFSNYCPYLVVILCHTIIHPDRPCSFPYRQPTNYPTQLSFYLYLLVRQAWSSHPWRQQGSWHLLCSSLHRKVRWYKETKIKQNNRQIKKECWKIRALVHRATIVQNFRAKCRCLIAEKPTLSIEWNCLEFGKCAHVLENEKFQLLQM